jgi:hypothetical protein
VSKKIREITPDELNRKRAWQGRSLKDRLEHIVTIVVPHPQFTHAVNEIVARRHRVITQKMGGAFCVIAATGGGKTTLAETIQHMFPDIETDDRTIRRVVYFSVPPRPSSVSMSSATLKALGDPRWEKGRADVLAYRAIHLLKECKTEIILLDNTHDIPERRTLKGVREVGNWIRDIIDQVPALFVSIGAEQGMDVFRANSQTRRRSPAAVHIAYFDFQTPQGMSRFRRFLFELDLRLPVSEMSNLSDFETAKRIGLITNGIPDYIIKLLSEAIEHALKNNRENIAWEDLRAGVAELFEECCSEELNPFSPNNQTLRQLDQAGEPFEDWLEDGYA